MTTHDTSRFLFQPAKHYIGARWQQGRCLLDSDFNEHAQHDAEDQRRVIADIIGPVGSPDQGFSLDLAVGDEVTIASVSFGSAAAVDVLDLRLRPGSMYVGGLRFEHGPSGEPLAFQRDFLQIQADGAARPQTGETHRVLTVLEAYEHHVSAVEDEELRERALGGIDTSVRVRRTAQVRAFDVEAEDCAAAWAEVRDRLESEGGGTLSEQFELQSSARLRITFDDGAAEDPCAPCGPHDAGRYLGADNQAIRIMLVQAPSGGSAGRYVWAFDNASPLYRVALGEDDDGVGGVVQMLTEPRDEARWPLSQTVIELLPWGALLDNGQKLSAPIGRFFRVTEGYDPDRGSFRIDPGELSTLDDLVQQWDAAHPDRAQLPNGADPEGQYLFMRVWHRLDAGQTDPLLSTGADPNNHVLLRRLGINPTFTGVGQPGDYWTASVRPNTPQQIVPWNLTQGGGVPPHGPRRFHAPLTLVTFRPPQVGEHENTEVVEALHDCRKRFRPLVERAGCCTHTVGDGTTSKGEYPTIQAAIEALPPAGGRVCVLPGTYRDPVVIERSDVVVEGCGTQSRLETEEGAEPGPALVQILAARVELRDLHLSTRGQVGVLVGSRAETNDFVEDVTLARLEIVADQRAGEGGQTRSAVDVRQGRRVIVRDCRLSMDGSVSDEAVISVQGEDLGVEHNRIESYEVGGSFGAWGGLQIGGGSSKVRAHRNRIVGGVGHGITLGSVRWVPVRSRGVSITLGPGAGLQNTQDPCKPRLPVVQPIAHKVGTTILTLEPRLAGDLADVVINDNHIESMQGNGISVLTTLELDDDQPEGDGRITVDEISIERNRIVDNVTQPAPRTQPGGKSNKKQGSSGDHDVFGQFSVSSVPPSGIALLDGEHVTIRDNEIRDNGTGEDEPVCGIYIAYGDHIVIEGNRITGNGLRNPGKIASMPSSRAGIVVALAGVASNQVEPTPGGLFGSSLRVIGNVVEHPNGPALVARATGPMMVVGNHLESLGNNASAQVAGRAHTVVLVNVGRPWEAVDLAPGQPSSEQWSFPARTVEYLHGNGGGDPGAGEPSTDSEVDGQDGRIEFSDNHVTLRWVGSSTTGGLSSGISVSICSTDSVTMIGNQLALDVEEPNDKVKKKKEPNELDLRPRIVAHAAVAGATANVSNNRVSEGVNDALISLLVLGGLLVSSTSNVTTHLSFATTSATLQWDTSNAPLDDPTVRVDRGNLVWLRPQTNGEDGVAFRTTVTRTANELFAAMSTNCLGLGNPNQKQTLGRRFGSFVSAFGLVKRE